MPFLRNIRLHEVSFVDKGASGDEKNRPGVLFWKRLVKPFTRRPVRKEQNMPTLEQCLAKLTDEEKAVVMQAIEQAAAKKDEPKEGDDVMKRADVPEDVRKQLSEQATELAKMRAERKRDTFIAKAKALPYLPGSTDEVATMIEKAADSMKPEDFKKYEEHLAKMNAAAKVSKALEEKGSGGSEGGGPQDKFDALVTEEVKKSDGKLTRQQAVRKVANTPEGRELYAEIQEARRGAVETDVDE